MTKIDRAGLADFKPVCPTEDPREEGLTDKERIRRWQAFAVYSQALANHYCAELASLRTTTEARGGDGSDELDQDKVPRWPPLKRALWDVVTGEKLNDGHYVNAYDLTDKLYAAAALQPASVAGKMPSEEALSDRVMRRWRYLDDTTGWLLLRRIIDEEASLPSLAQPHDVDAVNETKAADPSKASDALKADVPAAEEGL